MEALPAPISTMLTCIWYSIVSLMHYTCKQQQEDAQNDVYLSRVWVRLNRMHEVTGVHAGQAAAASIIVMLTIYKGMLALHEHD